MLSWGRGFMLCSYSQWTRYAIGCCLVSWHKNPRLFTKEAEAGGLPSLKSAWAAQGVQGQPGQI